MAMDGTKQPQARAALKKAFDEVRRSEDQLRLIIDTVPALAWSTNPDGSFEFVNRRWRNYTGLSTEEVQEWDWKSTIHGEDIEHLQEVWSAALASGAPSECEARLRRFDGQYRRFLIRGSPLMDNLGEVSKWFGIGIDIEVRGRPEQSAGKPEPSFQSILANIPGFVAIMSAAGEVEFASRDLMNYFNSSVEELSSWAATDAVHPDDLPRVLAEWKRSVETGDEYEIEHRLRRADGIYRWFHVRGRPERDASGQIVRWHQALIDIEDRKRTEESARANERDFRLIIDSIPGLIHTMRPSGEVEFVSQPVLDFFDKTMEEMNEWPSLVHPDDRARLIAIVSHSIEAGQFYETECRVLRADGIYRWFSSRGRPLRDAEGRIVRWYNLLVDIDDRKRAEESLQRSESYLSEAQKLSHTGSFGLNVASGEIVWSDETYRITGFDSSIRPTLELVLQRVHPEDRQRVRETLDRAIQIGSDWDFEHRFLMADGSVKHVHVLADATRSELNHLEYIGAVTDVTAIRQAEEDVLKSEEKYRELIQLSPDAICVVDETGFLVSINPAGLQMLKCTAEEASGLNIAETCVLEDRADFSERLKQLKAGCSYQIERTCLRRDGSTLPVEISVSPVRNGRSQAVIRDISERRRAQEALQRSEFYLSEGEKLSHTGSWAYDLENTKIIYWSAEYFRMERRDPSQPIPSLEEVGKGFTQEEWAKLMGCWGQAIEEKKDFVLETLRMLPDGSIQHLRVVGHPVVNAAGEVVEILGMSRDITEQAQAKEALDKAFDEIRKSEDQLRLIIDTIPALAWSTGPDGSLEFVNQRWREYTGLSTEDVRGWGWKSAVYSDDIELLIELWREALISGEATECEARLRRFDGEFRWFLFRTVPLRDETGKVFKWYGTNTDIEDRKRAEEALQESATNLRLIVDTIPALVWCAMPDGRLEYVNQRIVDYVGAPVSELAEHGWINFLHPDDAEPTLSAWTHAIGTGAKYESEYKMRGADGSYRWFHVLGQPLRNSDGRIIRWYGLITDIEDRKNAAEILRRTQARLSQSMQIATIAEFAASIAHEVNQPLAAVVANGHACLRWLLAQPPNLAEANLAAERIIRDGNGAAEVVRRIRALFKQAEPEMIPLDLNEVLAEVVRLLKGESVRHGVLVETGLDEDLPPIMADRLQLQQVIFNLVQNGIEAMDNVPDRSKKLVIRSRRKNANAILVEIRDHGAGLSDFDKPFEAFYTTKEGGMGMGLAICRSIIDAHRGSLWAAPTEGPGATFCFSLPLGEGAAPRNSDPY
jgi:PAS domain S-box-containing protein